MTERTFRVFFVDTHGSNHFDTQGLRNKNAVRHWCDERGIKYYNIVDYTHLSENERASYSSVYSSVPA